MAPPQLMSVVRHLRTLVNAEGIKNRSDGELLRSFVGSRNERAFAELLYRYGPMVQRLCRRVLGHEQDAEDAFQATFLVLARRAASIRESQAVAGWLYQVAHRIAMKAGQEMTKRRIREGTAAAASPAEPSTEAALRELHAILQEEVNRLPEKYRAPLVLCCLEGKSGAEAARQLGWREGTVSGRLTEARRRLQRRLRRRGVTLPAALCVACLSGPGMTAAVPANLARATLTAALPFAAGRAPVAGMVSAHALALADWMLRAATAAKVIMTTALVVVVSLLGLGAGLASHETPTPATLTQGSPSQSRKDQPSEKTNVPHAQPAKQPAARLDRFGDPLPEGALARLGTVRWRQGWMACRLVFSPDGTTLAVAGIGRPIGLWDVASGKELHQFHQRDSQPDGIAFSPDGAMLAEGDNSVRLWNTKTGALLRELPAAASQRAVVFTPDGNMLISGGHDKLIHLWNPHSGESLGELKGHTSSVLTLAVTKDGSTLASGGSDNRIRLWELARRKQIQEIKGHDKEGNYFHELSFSPDGRWLAAAEADGHVPARVWDARTGKQRFQLGDDSSRGWSVAFSADGTLIASGHQGGAIRLWDAATGKQMRHWACPYGVKRVAFSPNGKILATSSSWDSGPRLWDVATGAEIRPSETHRGMIQQICLTPDGKSLLSLGRDKQLFQWDLATAAPKRLMTLPKGKRWYGPDRLSHDGRVLAQTAAPAGTVTLVDPQTRKRLRAPLQLEDDPVTLLFSPDDQTLAIGCLTGGFYLWKWQADAGPRKVVTPEKDFIILHLFTPDGKQLVTGSMNRNNTLIHLWDLATGKRILSLPGNNGFPTCAISPDGKWAVGATYRERSIHVFEVVKRKEVRTIPVAHAVSGLAFSPDSQFLAYGENANSGGRVGLVDFVTGETVASYRGQHSGVESLVFSADGRSLFSGAGDSTIMHWDATGRRGKRPFHVNLAAAWTALGGDLQGAYAARWDFIDSPREAIALLRQHVRPVPVPKSPAFQKLAEALGADSFTERQKAGNAIKALGLSAEPLLRQQLKRELPLEARRRLQGLYDELMKSSTWRRTRAALAIVSEIRSADARHFLEELAGGHPEARLTLMARDSLARMNQARDATCP